MNFGHTHPLDHIGDLESTEPGTAARYNGGKPALELIPLALIAEHWAYRDEEDPLNEVVLMLGKFQFGGGAIEIFAAMDSLSCPWSECANVFDYGRRKYAEWNWLKGMPWSAAIGSAARHLLRMKAGEFLDPESGLPHRGHVMCNLVMLATYIQAYPQGDDRPKYPT